MSVLDWLLLIATVAVMVGYVKIALSKNRDVDRHAEDDARTFFDKHGHWPDETAEEAAQRAERAALSERVARSYQD